MRMRWRFIKKDVRAMWNANIPIKEIASFLMCKVHPLSTQIYKWRREDGEAFWPKRRPPIKHDLVTASKLWEIGLPVATIAKFFNTTERNMNGIIENSRKRGENYFPLRVRHAK